VRYRLNQIRQLYGDRLNDPDMILELTVALGSGERPRRPSGDAGDA
jgi:DNA-binding PucR family transcriptional regulator